MNPSNATSRLQAVYGENEGGATDPSIDLQPMMGLEFASLNGTVTLTANTATISWQPIKKKCRVMGVRAIGQDAYTGGTIQIFNGTDAISGTVAAAVAGTVTNGTVNPTYSILEAGDVLKCVVARSSGATMNVSVLVDLAPIGNL